MSARAGLRSAVAVVAAVAVALGVAGCGGAGATTATTAPAPARVIHLTSTAFAAGGAIPRAYTCDGADLPPPLRWSGVPATAKSLSLVMRDPDAPGGDFVHWSVLRIPPSATHLGGSASLPPDALVGRNGFGSAGYRGPCPPHGDHPHQYIITLTAVRSNRTALATGTLVATYGR